jgi:hypothetical protein
MLTEIGFIKAGVDEIKASRGDKQDERYSRPFVGCTAVVLSLIQSTISVLTGLRVLSFTIKGGK